MDDGMHQDPLMSSSARALDAGTISELTRAVDAAKANGWQQADLRHWFSTKSLTLQDYKTAVSGEPVADGIAASLIAITFDGLPSQPYAPDPAQIRQHIEWLTEPARGDFDDALFEIAWSNEAGAPNHARLFELDEVEEAVAFASERNAERRNVYIGAALRLPDTKRSGRASAADFYVATAVPIDIDHDYDETRARMAAVCDDGLVVTTGTTPNRRSQHWTRLVEPCDDEGEFGHAFAALVMSSGADLKVKDAARIMRLGGSVSYPDQRKRDAGYRTELTRVLIRADAKPSDLDRLKALEPTAAAAERHDSTHAAGTANEIETDWTGRVTDGREAFFRDIVLTHLRRFQEENGADPEPTELFDAAFAEFSDGRKVDNRDTRWTCEAGRQQLMARVQNTLRRLRGGRLARVGLYSYETGEGQAEAETVAANRAATKAPEPFVERIASDEGQPVADEPAEVIPGAQPAFDPWERYLVPTFPTDTLPTVLRDFVEYQAASVGGDPAAVAMAALAACSGALDQNFTLKMKRSGDWHVKPRLWVMLVGDPSSKKTPVISACVKPIRAWERTVVERYQADFGRWKADKEEGAKEPEPAKPTRYLFNDITAEKLGDILARQDRGSLVEQDEISGWLGAMDKYGGGKGAAADRGFWIQAYNGGPRTIDRLSRGELYVKNLCVGFIGGVQPDRLAELGNLTSDGLLQRFLPVMMKRAVYPAEVESDAPAEAYKDLIGYLIRAGPHSLQMDEGALAAAEEFQRYIFDLEAMDGLGKGFCTFAGKLTGVQGSLALLLHLIDSAGDVAHPVPERQMRAATRILKEFVIPHAMELYRSTTDGADWDYLRKLSSFVLTSPKDRFTASDFTTGVHSLRGLGVWDVAQKLSPLVAGGWLNEDDSSKSTRAWVVVPQLREKLATRRKLEIERKAEVLATIKTMRKGRADD